MKNNIGWFSCGITSAVACKLAIDKLGRENIDLYYIDISSAHPDNKRFIDECENWYGTDIKIVKSKKYDDQFDVFRHKRFINGPTGAPCTTELKKTIRWKIEKEYNYPTQIFGFEYSKKEINRAIRFIQQYPNAKGVFPLIENKLSKDFCAGILNSVGIELPEMYKLGFNNNNCIGCVKGGKGYWNQIKLLFPEVFYQMSDLEREIGRSCINGTFLDELKSTAGKKSKIIVPDCGTFCELKYTDVIDPLVDLIYHDPNKIYNVISNHDFY